VNSESRSVFSLRWFAQSALVVLAAALPFELVRPVAPLGPLQLSSVEVFLYAAVGLWAASRGIVLLRERRAPWSGPGGVRAWWRTLPGAHRAVAGWSLALVLSALFAPLERAAATKFALRSLGGVTLFLATSDLLDSRRRVWRTLTGLAVGAAVAALLMAFEIGGGHFAALLRPFHGQSFGVLGLARASGPFQYPNIAAMYLEAAVPIVMAVGVLALDWVDVHEGQKILVATTLVGGIMLYALVMAASRAGLITELCVLAGAGALARDQRTLRRLAFGLAGGLLVLTVVAQALSPLLALRLRFWEQRSWYGSIIEPTQAAPRMPEVVDPGAEVTVPLTITNTGALTWPAEGKKPVQISYHWMADDGVTLLVLEGRRTTLKDDVPSDTRINAVASVKAPERPGRYVIWWDLVHEGVTWFSDAGAWGYRQRVAVGTTPSPRKPRMQRTSLNMSAYDEFSRQKLWYAGLLAFRDHPLLGIGPDNFRHAYGHYLGREQTDDRLHANNFYIEVLATMGLAGLAAFIALIIALARTARRAAALPSNRVLVFGIGAALAAYLVHGTLDYFLEFTPTYGLLWLLAGALVGLERLSIERSRAIASARAAAIAGAGVISGSGAGANPGGSPP
jgi:hypothetical protein